MSATTAVLQGNGSVPAGDGSCGRAGCGRPLPAGDRGRSRRFCSDECRRRHCNALRGRPAPVPAAPGQDDGPATALGRLTQLLAESSRLAVSAAAQLAETSQERVAAVLAEAEAARRGAEAHAATAAAQAAESAQPALTAWEASDAADAARAQAEERARTAAEHARELERQLAGTSAGLTEKSSG